MNRASGLALFTAAIALWNAAHLPAAVARLTRWDEEIPDEHLDYFSPLGREHITLTGTYRPDLMATSTLETLLNDHPQ